MDKEPREIFVSIIRAITVAESKKSVLTEQGLQITEMTVFCGNQNLSGELLSVLGMIEKEFGYKVDPRDGGGTDFYRVEPISN